ncbi:alpha-glycosidase [Ammoniphilus sp. 3BR4]|uniref:alpha-glycosidase n=1 Tax=Ammoniphilus sp. 3BR4 TaxID=3158265 RepID=UPI0034651FB2
MFLEAIYHRPKDNYAYAYDSQTVHLRVRTKKNDVQKVNLYHGDKYNWDYISETSEMIKIASDELFDYWQVEVRPPYRRLRYSFQFLSGSKQVWMTESGFLREKPPNGHPLFEFPFINPIDVFQPPTWVKDAVFYQIFPERFANGDPTNDPDQIEDWTVGEPKGNNYFGGDLQGVIDHLDHLIELGINAIYFTPIFEAMTNHKYDTKNYLKVDPHFGNNEKLKELVRKCHGHGIRVLLDAVFNHSGFHFQPFQDVLNHGARSKYKDWFHIREFPIKTHPLPNYDTFAFVSRMPKLNTENPEVKEYLLEVARYWMEEVRIDGWRLDVANEVDHHFWREFRQTVKNANPDAYILGEIWHDSMPWLQGDQFDSVMNYPFTNAVLDFFARKASQAEQFRNQINRVNMSYPLQVNEAAFNLLDSHDTPRLLTMCEEDTKRMRLAVLFQLTYVGTPCIYYGDEVGMTGGHDPGCRKPMVWDQEKQDRELFQFYKQLIGLRKKYSALRTGLFRFLKVSSKQAIAYERKDNQEHFVIVVNNHDQPVTLNLKELAGSGWEEALTDEILDANGKGLTLSLPGYGYAVLRKIS